MRLPHFQLWQAVRSSYWFVPSVMAIGAVALGAIMVWLDSGPAAGLLEPIGWYQQSKPEGARAVLSAIAGSMITVAGVVFSITIVAISYAANQYGPRILTNFMSDRGNQVTLGTFIATFVYSVVVLRTIYSGGDGFVPQLAIFGAMFLVACSIAVLIYFIHHVPESIHVNHVVAKIGRQLIETIDKTFPACFGDPPEKDPATVRHLEEEAASLFGEGARFVYIRSQTTGYLQAMDDDALLRCASEHRLVVQLLRTPGDFLFEQMAVARAAPADRVDEKVEQSIRSSYTAGSRRTPFQDLLFLVDELVDVAARSLSTGINDPFTAITCVDWLTAGASEMARRQSPSPYRLDDDGQLRVIAPSSSFAEQVERGFGRVRPYLAGDINAAKHSVAMLGKLAGQCRSAEQVECVRTQLEALVELSADKLDSKLLPELEKAAADSRTAIALAERRLGEAG